MKNEMDLLHMDERQRLAWLLANRGTVTAVGAIWIGMIVWELYHGRSPAFLIVMIPVFALLRLGLFFYYCSRPLGGDEPRGRHLAQTLKGVAAVLLVVSSFLPIYRVAGWSPEVQRGYAWRISAGQLDALVPLLFVYLWPVATLLLPRFSSRRSFLLLNQLAEPFLAAASTIVLLWIPQFIFRMQPLFGIPLVPVGAHPDWGCILAVSANGLYFVGWLSERLRPWRIQASVEAV